MQSTIYASYSGHWDNFAGGGDTFNSIFGVSSRGGSNGGIGGLKLQHYEYGDRFRDVGIGFVQFNTSSIPANATISTAFLNVWVTRNNFAFGGVGMARSNMAVGWRYDEGLDEWISGNILTGNLTPGSGLTSFNISNPNTNITKANWSRYHVGTTHVMDRVSPGIAAGVGADDFNMDGYDSGTVANRPKLIINWTTTPAVTTGVASNFQPIKVTLAGNITDVGYGTVSACGICIGKTANPTIAGTKFNSTDKDGQFVVNATGLLPGTTYHYRAYVTTENSTVYGADAIFSTPGGAILFNFSGL